MREEGGGSPCSEDAQQQEDAPRNREAKSKVKKKKKEPGERQMDRK